MRIIVLGAAGFIGTNLTLALMKDKDNQLTLVDRKKEFFLNTIRDEKSGLRIWESSLDETESFDEILKDQDIVYHLVSTNSPTTSNKHITEDIQSNVVFSSKLFEACIHHQIKKVVFISSGGTVYGREAVCPIHEDAQTNPISSYGVQKITIEKLLSLYHFMYGLDYRIIRLANPYGPYQRPDGVLGAVTTFTYKALNNEEIIVYGDGSVVRDFIYIDDAIRAILKIVDNECEYHTFNVGSGHGTSINEVLMSIENTLGMDIQVVYQAGRAVDVPVNYLDVSRYEGLFGKLNPLELGEGIKKTADFLKNYYLIRGDKRDDRLQSTNPYPGDFSGLGYGRCRDNDNESVS